jgi:hypothetical protein
MQIASRNTYHTKAIGAVKRDRVFKSTTTLVLERRLAAAARAARAVGATAVTAA